MGPEQVREYLLHLMNDHEVVASTILVNRSALRFLYVATLKQKWFDEEIACPKRRPTLPGMLSAAEITRILDHTNNLKHWTILATFYATALRANELRHLRVSDLDSQRMVLHVRLGKGGVPRDIALSPVLLDRLRVYFRWRRPADWLFPSKQRQDQPLDLKSIWDLCCNAGKRAGIGRPVYPHLFRHACATHMLDAGADLRTIQVLLGHSDIRSTARYLNVSLQRLQAIRSPFDALQLKPIDQSEDDGRQR
jgi:site-specific recombinase XerD